MNDRRPPRPAASFFPPSRWHTSTRISGCISVSVLGSLSPKGLLCRLAFGHRASKALPVEKINSETQMSAPFNGRAKRPLGLAAGRPPVPLLCQLLAQRPGQPVTNPLLCNLQCHLFIGFCHTHIVKGNFVLHLARERVPEGQTANTFRARHNRVRGKVPENTQGPL